MKRLIKMKFSTIVLCVIVGLLQMTVIYAHIKPESLNAGISYTRPVSDVSQGFGAASSINFFSDFKLGAYVMFLSVHPQLLCTLPTKDVVQLLTKLSCSQALLNIIPKPALSNILTTVTSNSNLVNALPPTVLVTLQKSVSAGVSPQYQSQQPQSQPAAPAAPAAGSPGVTVTKEVAASVSGAQGAPVVAVSSGLTAAVLTQSTTPGYAEAPPQSAESGAPAVTVNKEVSAAVSPYPAAPGAPAVTVTKEVSAAVSPYPAAPGSPLVAVNSETNAVVSSQPAASPATAAPTDYATQTAATEAPLVAVTSAASAVVYPSQPLDTPQSDQPSTDNRPSPCQDQKITVPGLPLDHVYKTLADCFSLLKKPVFNFKKEVPVKPKPTFTHDVSIIKLPLKPLPTLPTKQPVLYNPKTQYPVPQFDKVHPVVHFNKPCQTTQKVPC